MCSRLSKDNIIMWSCCTSFGTWGYVSDPVGDNAMRPCCSILQLLSVHTVKTKQIKGILFIEAAMIRIRRCKVPTAYSHYFLWVHMPTLARESIMTLMIRLEIATQMCRVSKGSSREKPISSERLIGMELVLSYDIKIGFGV